MAGTSSGGGIKGGGKSLHDTVPMAPDKQAKKTGRSEGSARAKAEKVKARTFGTEYGGATVEKRKATPAENLEQIAKSATGPAGAAVDVPKPGVSIKDLARAQVRGRPHGRPPPGVISAQIRKGMPEIPKPGVSVKDLARGQQIQEPLFPHGDFLAGFAGLRAAMLDAVRKLALNPMAGPFLPGSAPDALKSVREPAARPKSAPQRSLSLTGGSPTPPAGSDAQRINKDEISKDRRESAQAESTSQQTLRLRGGAPTLRLGLDGGPINKSEVVAASRALSRTLLTPAERVKLMPVLEAALLDTQATVVSRRSLGGGINATEIVELSNGVKAVWKPSAGEYMTKLRDNLEEDHQARREAAAYLIDKALGHVAGAPPTVLRSLEGKQGALMLFVEGTPGADAWRFDRAPTPADVTTTAVFDEVIGNTDRHKGNYMIAKSGALVPIDHGLILPLRNGAQGFLNADFARNAPLEPQHRSALEMLVANTVHLPIALVDQGIAPEAVTAMRERAKKMLADGKTHADWMKADAAHEAAGQDAIRNIR